MQSKMQSLKVSLLFALLVLACSIQCASAATKQKDPYKVLGVERDASEREIKQAYKHLVMKWHPDKSSNPKATSMFMSINEAYTLLSDPHKRELYDRYGSTVEMPFGGYRQKNSGGYQRRPASFQNMPYEFPFNNFRRFDDPFEHMFHFTFGNRFQEVPRSFHGSRNPYGNQTHQRPPTPAPSWFDRAFSMFDN